MTVETQTHDEARAAFCQQVEDENRGPFFCGTEEVLTEVEACADILPSDTCDSLGIPAGSTYAQAVKKIRKYRRGEL